MNREELRLPMDEFIVRAKSYIPATYGKMVAKKICHDSKNKMMGISVSMERGDATISSRLYYEVKVSYLNKCGRFGIKNIRPWQLFDYFIMCLVDTTNNGFKTFYYCVPKHVLIDNPVLSLCGQNNTKVSNELNGRVGMSTTFDLNDHSWLFKEESVLKGTTYNDLMEYIDSQVFHKSVVGDIGLVENNDRERELRAYEKIPFVRCGGVYVKDSVDVPVVKSSVVRGSIRKVYLKMGNKFFKGVSNKDVMTKLVNHIGPKKLDGILWSAWLNKYESSDRNVYVGDGYFLNPKFSMRDFTTMISKINKELKFSIKIINK